FGGTHDPTFEKATDLFGFDINAQNLADKRGAMLDFMRARFNDPATGEAERRALGNILQVNDTIARIQKETGADVIHAAGNTGPNEFSLEFMTANIQLRSEDPRGVVDKFSAN